MCVINAMCLHSKSRLIIFGNRETLRRVGECGYPLVGKIQDYTIQSMKGSMRCNSIFLLTFFIGNLERVPAALLNI